MESRFSSLRFLSRIFKVLAALALLVMFLLAIGVLLVMRTSLGEPEEISLIVSLVRQMPTSGIIATGITTLLIVFLYGGVIAASLFTFGESLNVMLAVEENTRASAVLLNRMAKREDGS